MPFRNRKEAGCLLAARLTCLADRRPVILALPRGGVPVAFEVARALNAPLDVIIIRKLGVPFQPELGMGAIGEDGVRVLNPEVVRMSGVAETDVAAVEQRERAELVRRAELYRRGRPRIDVEGRTVIIVDDGIATGGTARAAIEVVRVHGAEHVVLAVPVAPPETVRLMETLADEVICVETPEAMHAIGAWYDDFSQTSDDEVVSLLRRAAGQGETQAAAVSVDRSAGELVSEEDPPHLVAAGPARWQIARTGAMRVPGVVFASADLLPAIEDDQSVQQVVNVASLPGVVEASYAMPDMHWGYGFPIGGVAATDVERGGVISPGGVGFDISCGVRVLVSDLDRAGISPRLDRIMDRLADTVPCGLGKGGVWGRRNDTELDDILVRGAETAVETGFGDVTDLENCEDAGCLPGAAPEHVSARARERGRGQVGSLGSGNHFLEVQVVDRVFDTARAEAFGLAPNRVCVMIHTGSRGLGHQVCTDHVHVMEGSMSRYGISVPDRQLACAPVRSPEGEAYMGAMAAAANYGRVNRQLLTYAARRAFASVCGRAELRLLYDISHNLAKLERHTVSGSRRLLCVHRKGATRALPPGHGELPVSLREWGQPVLVPGSMGTASYVLCGIEGGPAFHSCCHGAGRTMSRHAAKRKVRGEDLARDLEAEGILVRAGSMRGLAEEAPFAYKDVDAVVAACEEAGLAHIVARLRPIGVVKG